MLKRGILFILILTLSLLLASEALGGDGSVGLQFLWERSLMNLPWQQVPGWPYYTNPNPVWSINYPPGWQIQQDQTGIVYFSDSTQSYFFMVGFSYVWELLTREQFINLILQSMTGGASVQILMHNQVPLPPILQMEPIDFIGFSWTDQQGVKYVGVLSVWYVMPSAMVGSTSFGFMAALSPASAFDEYATSIVAPMGTSFLAPKPGGGEEEDRDGDGVPDDKDKYPDDPERW